MNATWLYVGVLYAGAVALARRSRIDLPKRIALFFFLLVLAFFFKPMTQAYVNIPVDVLTILPPWSLDTGRNFLNSEMNDITFQQAPWAHQAREALKAGRAPLWNEAAGSGYPLLANGQSSALSPIRLLALPLNLGHAMTAEAAMKILIALTFTFLYCRGRKLSELASTLGAVMFGFGGFFAVWLHFPIITTACFLPAVMYLVDRFAEKPSYGSFVTAAVVWASIVYGGHPETASHIFVLAFLYAVWIVVVERSASWRLFLVLGAAMIVAAFLAAPFLATFLEALPRSLRYDTLKLTPWTVEALSSKDMQSAIAQLQAHFFGRVPMEGRWGPSKPDTISGWAGVLGFAAWVALLIGVVSRRAWRSRETFYVLASVFVVGVIFGWPILSEGVHRVLPLVAHDRFRLLLTMLLAIQSALIVDRLEHGEWKHLLAGIVVVAVALLIPFLIVTFPAERWLTSARIAVIPSVVVLGLAALGRHRFARILLLVAVIAEVWSVTYPWSPPLREELMYPRTPFVRALEEFKAKEQEPFRVAGWAATFFPNTAPMFGLEDIRVHDPMANARYMGYLRLATGYSTWDYFAHWKNVDTPLLDYLNVRYLLVDDPSVAVDQEHFEPVYTGHDGLIFRNRRFLPRFYPVRNVILESREEVFNRALLNHKEFAQTALLDKLDIEAEPMRADFFNPRPAGSPLATSKIVRSQTADYRIAVKAPRWSLVVSSIPWWPGWKVERNGKRVDPIRVNGLFLGFAVPPGESDVRVWYAPWTFWGGVWLAGLTSAALLVAGCWLFVVARQKPQATSNRFTGTSCSAAPARRCRRGLTSRSGPRAVSPRAAQCRPWPDQPSPSSLPR